MGEKDREIDLPGGSFSRLLLSVEDVEEEQTFLSSSFSPPPLFSINTPKMLCFGDFGSQTTRFNSAVSSSVNTHKNGNGAGGQESGQRAECKMGLGGLMVGQNQKNVKTKKKMKKNKLEVGPINASSCHAKAKREKLGERITSLQQLVSPYGKTDTASVLHEAMGYIRFLHDQVKVLSSPYLQRPDHLSEKGQTKARVSTKGLRSRGLCLVPVQYIVDVANTNGADFWSSSTTSLSTP